MAKGADRKIQSFSVTTGVGYIQRDRHCQKKKANGANRIGGGFRWLKAIQ